MASKTGKTVTGRPPRVPDSRSSIHSDEAPLRVFVSSAIRGLEAQRQAAKDAINRLVPFTRAWIFEETPASEQDVDDYYLDKVRSSDLVVLLVEDADRDAVRNEYLTAQQAKVPVLAFVRRIERTKGFEDWVNSVRQKRADYESETELSDLVYVSVGDWIIRHLRSSIKAGREVELLASVSPQAPHGQLRDIMNGMVVGFDPESELLPMFRAFSGVPHPQGQAAAEPFEDIYINDWVEMNQALSALSRVIDKARQFPDDDRVFFRALNEEAARRATHYGLQRAGLREASEPQSFAGTRYTVLHIRKDWAQIVRLLRVRDVVETPTEDARDGAELYFRYPQVFQHLGEFIEVAEREPPRDFLPTILEQVNVLIAGLQADEILDAEEARTNSIEDEPLAQPIEVNNRTAMDLLSLAADRIRAVHALGGTPRDLRIKSAAVTNCIEAATEAKGRFYPMYRVGFRPRIILDAVVRLREELSESEASIGQIMEDLGHALGRLIGDTSVEQRILSSLQQDPDAPEKPLAAVLLTLEAWLEKTCEDVRFNDIVDGE